MTEARMNYAKIKAAIPPPKKNKTGRPHLFASRADLGQIVADVVLEKRTMADVGKTAGCNPATVRRFFRDFVGEEVRKLVHLEAARVAKQGVEDEIDENTSHLEAGLYGVVEEQKRLYAKLNSMANVGSEEFAASLGPMMQLLRDQTRTYEAALKMISTLKRDTTVQVALADHPDVHRLLDVLYFVFRDHPEAFEDFQRAAIDRRLPIDVG